MLSDGGRAALNDWGCCCWPAAGGERWGRQGYRGKRDRGTNFWSWAGQEKGGGVRKFCLSWRDIAIVHAHREWLWLITRLAKTLNPNKYMRPRSVLLDCSWGPWGQASIMPECQQWHHSMGRDPGLYRTEKLGQLLPCSLPFSMNLMWQESSLLFLPWYFHCHDYTMYCTIWTMHGCTVWTIGQNKFIPY